jgi:hypothetical protein
MASPSKKKSSKISRRTSAKITPGKSPGKIQKPGDMRVMGRKRILNVLGDPPDIRDRIYEPPLIKLEHSMEDNMVPSLVRDQGAEGACTGFGLAAVIDLLKFKAGEREFRASTRMLYEMAKKHDEWPGEDYDGSSCRGAIRGWHNMGVCEEGNWPYEMSGADRDLTIDRAVAARKNTLGAYYRLQAEIVDYHAALNETGAVYVSANVHSGWSNPTSREGQLPEIKQQSLRTGGHAFAIVGYNGKGFIVQNSWGGRWGKDGFALWTYEDWLGNVMDGWVFRLAVPTPQIFGLVATSTDLAQEVEEAKLKPIKRVDIEGHFVHYDDGRYKPRGNYWSTGPDVVQTVERIAGPSSHKYGHLMIYAHGGLNSPGASARRIRALKDGFQRNGVYPYHIMYDTGLVEELKDVIKRAWGLADERAGAFTDWTDGIIEDAVRKPVTPIWEEMKRDAESPFRTSGDGTHTITVFADELANTNKKIHLVGHSTGGVLLGHLLRALDRLGRANLVASCSLMAPACTRDFYKREYEPRLGRGGGNGTVVRLPKLTIYNVSEELEEYDTVATLYRKSLLFLVSKALERTRDKPILGMQFYSKGLPVKPGLEFVYSKGVGNRSRSTTHGGFDNDEYTMNDILKSMLGQPPTKRFKPKDMRGY